MKQKNIKNINPDYKETQTITKVKLKFIKDRPEPNKSESKKNQFILKKKKLQKFLNISKKLLKQKTHKKSTD